MLQNKLYVHNLSDGKRVAEFPLEVGTVSGYSGKKEQTEVRKKKIEMRKNKQRLERTDVRKNKQVKTNKQG